MTTWGILKNLPERYYFFLALLLMFDFSILFRPHKCPDPKPRSTVASNFVIRHGRRALGYQCESLNRRLIHARFCPVQTIRLPTEEGFFTCAKFMVSVLDNFISYWVSVSNVSRTIYSTKSYKVWWRRRWNFLRVCSKNSQIMFNMIDQKLSQCSWSIIYFIISCQFSLSDVNGLVNKCERATRTLNFILVVPLNTDVIVESPYRWNGSKWNLL